MHWRSCIECQVGVGVGELEATNRGCPFLVEALPIHHV